MSDFKKILGMLGLFFVILILGVFAAVWMGFQRGEPQGTQQPNGGSCSILFPASAGTDQQIAKVIDDWTNKYAPTNSPLRGKGMLIAQSGRAGNVNPAIIIGIARKESSFGTAGGGVPRNNPFGRMDASHNLMFFSSWNAAIADQGPYLKRVYIDQGLMTIGSYLQKYAPPSDHNDTPLYIQQMTDWTNEMEQMGSGVVLGPACSGAVLANATGKWIWPANGPISSRFGETGPSHPNPHQGLDIAIPTDTQVKAVDSGTVSKINNNRNDLCGIYIYVDHGAGLQSLYCHLDPNGVKVIVGQSVSQGDVIALSDNTGHSTGPHLHLGAKLNGVFVNPENYLPKK